MRVLGIETATQVCGIAITDDAQLVGEYRLNIKNVHSERLVGAMEKLFADASLKPSDLDGIAVSLGPGSFTGLRIGLSVAKGMAYSLDIPIVAIPTLGALAWQAPVTSGSICAVLKARANFIYAECFQKNGETVIPERGVDIVKVDALEDFAKPGSLFIGNGTALITKEIAKLNGSLLPERYSLLSGLTIAIMGTTKFERGETEDVRSVEPLYVQEFIAQKPKHRLAL